MKTSLLVELLTEELPPKALKSLSEAFGHKIQDELIRAQLKTREPHGTKFFATPRRLAVLIPDVQAKAPDRAESKKLMPSKVAYGPDGNPSAALLKRLEKENASVKQTERKLEDDTEYVFLNQTIPGATLAAGLQIALQEAVSKLPIPKMMSYQLADGQTTVQFVRPAHGLVALHGDKVVNVSVLGLKAGRITHGHRFQGVKDIKVATADAYEEALAAHGKVIADFDERRAEIDKQLRKKAATLKTSLGSEEGVMPLLDEVTALVEYPTVYAGEFEREFLGVPQECLILTMRANQKYFPLFDEAGKLTNKFLIVSNMELKDPENIVEGNQRVVRPRLADARFFFETDKKTKLADRVPQLANIVYHNKLGSQLDRVERVRKLAASIAGLIGADAKLADRAAFLAKADLVTNMVGEFPELQGIIGCYYALADGEDSRTADAIQQHYKPRYAGDALPSNDIAVSLALADKLETLVGMFGIGQLPTGDKDPYALRRHALGVLRILVEKKLPLSLDSLLKKAHESFPGSILSETRELNGISIPNHIATMFFIEERAKNYLRDLGYSTSEVAAVLSLRVNPSEYVDRLNAVHRFLSLTEATDLAESDKRIRNILTKSGGSSIISMTNTALLNEEAEKKLLSSVRTLRPQVDSLITQQNFEQALLLTAQIHLPVKQFFDSVMVNVEDDDVRKNRFSLLHEVSNLTNRVANLSELVVKA